VTWSEEENVRWKVEIPGQGKSTPVIWGERLYLTTAEQIGEPVEVEPEPEPSGRRGGRGHMRGVKPTHVMRFQLLALNREDGSVAWRATATEKLPGEGTHRDGTWASGSAVTDGERIIAHFGSQGIFAFDMQGKKLWEKQLGQMSTRASFGEGTSPALYGDSVVVQWDHEGPSFIVVLEAATGEERWRRERDEVTSWATPLVVEVDGRPQVIANGTERMRAYDLETGKTVWELGGMTTNAIPTPVYSGGVAYLMSGFRGSAAVAIRLSGARGDLTDSEHVLWRFERDTPYVPSPLLVEGELYFLKSNSGILTVLDIEQGEKLLGPQRLPRVANVYASPVSAAGRVYLVGRDGETEVLELGGERRFLATNLLDERFDASPALAGGELYLRGEKFLYCLAEE